MRSSLSRFFVLSLLTFSATLAAQEPPPKLIIQGAENSELEFTLRDTDTMDILPSGSIVTRIIEEAVCEADPGECPTCPTCPTCPNVCDATLSFSQFQITANGVNYSNGASFTVTRGASITARWKAPGAVSCTATGMTGTSTWNGTTYEPFSDGTITVNTSQLPDLTTAATYAMAIQCVNGTTLSQTRQVNVTVEPATVPDPGDPSCVGVPTLQEASGGTLTRTNNCLLVRDHNCHEFASVFQNTFPGAQVQQQFRLLPNTYASMRFDVPIGLASDRQGGFNSEVLLGTQGGMRLMSISQCPGDFDASRLDARCIRSIDGADSFFWRASDGTFRCPVEPGRQYYLNIIYSQSPPGTAPSDIAWNCESPLRCGNLISPGHNVNF